MRYFFILGRNPNLSLAELNAVLPKQCSIQSRGGSVAIAEYPEIDVGGLMKQLGGTIKIGVIVARDAILDYLTNFNKTKKLFLGISAYALDEKTRMPTLHELRQYGIDIKRGLQTRGYKVRLVTSRDIALSSVIVEKEKLLSQGAEIVLLFTHGDTLIGKTLAVQEFEQASARDYGRPARSMGVGMIPIQLAKIMINLTRLPKDGVLLDPFCGFGTILSEALQMGYRSLVGADIKSDMIQSTKQNIEWLGRESGIRNYESGIELFCSPVEELSKHLAPNSIDAIVTEPYLGPVRGIMNYELGIMDELKSLYTKAFREFAKVLKASGKVVFIFPIFVTNGRRSSLSGEILPQIKKLGFQPMPLLPRNLITQLPNYPITSLVYSRENQKILREIFVFTLKK